MEKARPSSGPSRCRSQVLPGAELRKSDLQPRNLRLRSNTTLSPTFPLGDALEVYGRREDAERFIEEVRGDEAEVAKALRVEERELEVGSRN